MSLVLAATRSVSGEPGRNAILARLLCDAVEALECDIERPRASLVRAIALVGRKPVAIVPSELEFAPQGLFEGLFIASDEIRAPSLAVKAILAALTNPVAEVPSP
jgi:hypothetical protein